MRASILALVAVLAACATMGASAQTVYKLIDKNGKITYSEEAPKNFDGKVIRIDIDPNANSASLPRPSASATAEANDRRDAAAKKEQGLAALRKRLDDARAALKDAQDNPGAGEVERVGTKSGFTRAVPTEEYEKKLARLADDVKNAEEDLKRAGGSP